MTYLEIDKAIVDITRQMCAECKSRLDAVPKENGTERKALQLELGMYTFCGNAGQLFNAVGRRDVGLQKRRTFMQNELPKYPALNSVYQALDEEERMRFIAALQAELFIRDQWLRAQYAELSAAEEAGDTKSIFEMKIKIGAVRNMFSAWEAWRRENGVYPHLFEEDAK